MSRTTWAAAAVVCLASAVTACGPAGGVTLPVVAGRFGTDPVISLPARKPPGALVVRALSEGSGPVVRPDDYVLFDVAAKVWAGDRLVLDTFANHQPQGCRCRLGCRPGGTWPASASAAGSCWWSRPGSATARRAALRPSPARTPSSSPWTS
jgi:hypothetical protein